MTLISFPSPASKATDNAEVRPAASLREGDWSQQELADLYRVEAVLLQASMLMNTARGVTDEGDPWFVFCRPDGEVFVHLCRIDEQYLLDSPGLDTPLRGDDFASLIDQFVRNIASRTAISNVVQLRPARHERAARQHPTLMLTALIWSLYLASNYLMETIQAAELEPKGPAADDLAGLSSVKNPDALLAELDRELITPEDRETQNSIEPRNSVPHESGRGSSSERNWSSNAVGANLAATLTAIGVTYGLIEQRQIEAELDYLVNSETAGGVEKISERDREIVVADARQDVSDASVTLVRDHGPLIIDGAPEADLIAQISEALHFALQKLPSTIYTNMVAAPDLLPQAIAKIASSSMDDGSVSVGASPPAVARVAKSSTAALPAGEGRADDVAPLAALTDKYVGAWASYMQESKATTACFSPSTLDTSQHTKRLDEADAKSTNEENPTAGAALVTDGAASLLAELLGASPSFKDADTISGGSSEAKKSIGFQEYGEYAAFFIEGFLQRAGSVEIVQRGKQIILMDVTAFDEVSDHYSSVSWVTDSDLIVTVTGHTRDIYDVSLLLV